MQMTMRQSRRAKRTMTYVLLVLWAIICLFPIYWLVATSFKLPIDVNMGPFYVPTVDYAPSLHAWDYILVGDLSNDTLRQLILLRQYVV